MNILNKAAAQQAAFTKYEKENFGYETVSTFYSDLTIADFYGEKAVKDTFQRVVKSWFKDRDMFTEFVLCLNTKAWQHHGEGHMALSALYSDLFYKAKDKVYDEWSKEDIRYFFEMTD